MSLPSRDGLDTASPPSGLVNVASLTNRELFTAVIAAIKRSLKKQKKNQKINWQAAAIRVATSAARGERGYGCVDDWVRHFEALSCSDQGASGEESRNFGEAFKALPVRECYRKRLDNALSALSSSTSSTCENLSIRQAAGLIRGITFLTADGDDDARSSDCDLQASALSHLVQAMPQLSSNPCDIFLAVQLPILQKLEWDAFANGGLNVASVDVEAQFRSLLNLNFGEQCKPCIHSGEKRKILLISKDDGASSADKIGSSSMAHLLEAAQLARNGAVRAQHGAVIYIPSENNGKNKTKVIGRGWNHDFLLDRSKSKKNKIVLHSEVHAVVDAILHYGEDECFEKLFPLATIIIVELESDYAYETCHPCPKCDPMLRAVGITNILHTTPQGKIKKLDFSPNASLLSNENVSIPLIAACDEQKINCKRLQQALSKNMKE
mmetsp:Transcript_7473/g.16306  ORF Transcript_7473/g.16306 Transcript_7473/m.16306 type:complete len:438 (+) Transcript_7473:79-1392(+)